MKRFVLIIFILCFFACLHSDVSAVQTEIRILYVNDFHGFAEPYKPFSSDEFLWGIAYLAGRVETLRREKPSLLLAAGGDGYKAFGDALREACDFSVTGGMIQSEKIVYSDYSRCSIFTHSRPDPESIRDGTPRDPDKNRYKSVKILHLPCFVVN